MYPAIARPRLTGSLYISAYKLPGSTLFLFQITDSQSLPSRDRNRGGSADSSQHSKNEKRSIVRCEAGREREDDVYEKCADQYCPPPLGFADWRKSQRPQGVAY